MSEGNVLARPCSLYDTCCVVIFVVTVIARRLLILRKLLCVFFCLLLFLILSATNYIFPLTVSILISFRRFLASLATTHGPRLDRFRLFEPTNIANDSKTSLASAFSRKRIRRIAWFRFRSTRVPRTSTCFNGNVIRLEFL